MLQRLVDVRPRIFCDSVYGALAEVIEQLLVVGCPAVELVGKSNNDKTVNAIKVLDSVHRILTDGRVLDELAPISETAAGTPHITVPNPHQSSLDIPVRIRLESGVEAAAALLHTYLVLRVRYQAIAGRLPFVRLEAASDSNKALDVMYLVGDAFTERYPVLAEITSAGDRTVLTLTGQPALISGGLGWARGDYIRSRDASLLLRPLREAVEGPDRPLVIPREVRGPLGTVRVRVPEKARNRIRAVRWLSSLNELEHPSGGELAAASGALGEEFSVAPTRGGYLTSSGQSGLEAILPVRSIMPNEPPETILPESHEGSVAISMEALGGAREIGANSYYYFFGHRGLIIDAGFDATRDGWLGLPAFENLTRVDAVALTHAHLDHIGALPSLLAAIPHVPVYCTRATLAVLSPQLNDSAKVSGFRFEATGEAPALSRGLVESIRPDRFRVVEYNSRVEVPEIPGLTLEFRDAGHIIGSACLRLEFGGVSVLHTGDISVEDQHLLRGMRIDELGADHVVMEGTYCGEPRSTRRERRAAVDSFLSGIAERIDAGGSVLVPAFSLGRAQELVGMLVDWNDRAGRRVPIWTVGLVNVLNEISAKFPEFLPGLSGKPFSRVKEFEFPRSKMSDEERRDEYSRVFFELAKRSPCVVIASHGMMMENTGSYFIGRAILGGHEPQHAIFLCGYMDPRTPGFRLRYQAHSSVVEYGAGDPVERTIPAERIKFYRLTAHASYQELVEVALGVPKRSVTFVHGDGEGLDSLKSDLIARFQATQRDVRVRAPAIGERILLGYARPPEDWEFDTLSPRPDSESLATGRRFRRRGGFSVRGLTADGAWALIPIGSEFAIAGLEHDRIEADRIRYVELRTRRGRPVPVFDRDKRMGNLSAIQWSEPGETRWVVFANDPGGQGVRAEFEVFYGAELRSVRTALDATRPTLEVEVGGILTPKLLEVTSGRNGDKLSIDNVDWNSISRVLTVGLSGNGDVGFIEDVHLSLQWPNGFIQHGPGVGSFTLEPVIEFQPALVRVGIATLVPVHSTPEPSSARFDGERTELRAGGVFLRPKRTGTALLELEYRTRAGDREWRQAGVLEVQPSAIVDVPRGTDVDRGLELTVRDIERSLHGATVGIRVGSEVREEWIADENPHHWSGKVEMTDPLEIAVVAEDSGLVLWSGDVRVYGGIELNKEASLTVTTADGTLDAELTFVGPRGWSRKAVEQAFDEAGFRVAGWTGDTLRIGGTTNTVGNQDIRISAGSRTISIRVVTLSDLNLCLKPAGPFSVGDGASLFTKGGELAAGVESVDGGPLTIEVARVSPLFDNLSARIAGNRIHFLHPGSYSVALVAGNRRLAQLVGVAAIPAETKLPMATARVEARVATPHEASVRAAQFAPFTAVAVLCSKGGPHRVLQDDPAKIGPEVSNFISDRLVANERVLVTWPGLMPNQIAAQLLGNIRRDKPKMAIAHLSYPAPQGELVSNETAALQLLHHRVVCCALACSTIDLENGYACPQDCSCALLMKTDHNEMWFECPKCGYADRDVVLTLNRMRSTNVEVLFADFRLAKYLMRGRGRRYAGSLGRSVRCGHCHLLQAAFPTPSPWVREELHRLLNALSGSWESANLNRSIRRTAWRAAGRAPGSRPNEIQRFEDALVGLLSSKVIDESGRVVRDLSNLESGLSLCCSSGLIWSVSKMGFVFLGIEGLLSPAYPSATHPELSSGQTGIRQFLALAD